ncbi:hypothetical protein TVAG_310680 [Trichomonas vaginalis G3]|uniref:Mic1 domain-containing protein n=1 Tax=Trichomonas vaginalis (strain ATCC PRA-98 / G3) TaxID=412133 RepID=A2G0A1_TRIV3|nr:hypothetical protein TVAGG3_0140730 [Trichomonas vaginalis G3]EAX89416.1 hypothetical protein TVAG_310680 [Trichomonas vaginalis G3]KAI5546567.1 hypothetical protein TVAGG3_0140730 [Trichomonas vaginalis G3]|eukprot:XP_001302346.1 hypothetical protein [Trichomonas vaginalis G3]
MLEFHPTFPRQGVRGEKGSRVRIVGQSESSSLLFSVNTLSHTIVEQVNTDGSSLTVISFKGYIDIVSAALSHDKELIQITERIPVEQRFVFSSYIVDIQTMARSSPIQSNDPITAFFILQKQNNAYQLLHIIGNNIAHLTITVNKSEIKFQRVRGGVNIYSVIWWKFDIRNLLLSVVHRYDNAMVLSEFQFTKGRVSTLPILPFTLLEEQKLSPDFSYSPLSLSHLPYYEFTDRRVFLSHYKSKILLIQQVIPTSPGKIGFFISVYPTNFNDYIMIDAPNTEIPIAFYHCGECAIVFSPHYFSCFINFTRGKPSTHLFVEHPDDQIMSQNCQTIKNSNLLIDMDNGNIFEVVPVIDRLILNMASSETKNFKDMALFAQRSGSKQSLVSLFASLQFNWDKKLALDTLSHFIEYSMHSIKHDNIQFQSAPMFVPHHAPIQTMTNKEILQSLDIKTFLKSQKAIDKISPLLNDIESNFPSAVKKPTRRQIFFLLAQSTIQRKSKQTDEAALIAIRKMEKQNAIVTTIRIAFNEWKEMHKPSLAIYYCIIRILQHLTIVNLWPSIVGIDTEIAELYNNDEVHDAALHMDFVLNEGKKKVTDLPEDATISQELMSIDDQTIGTYDL